MVEKLKKEDMVICVDSDAYADHITEGITYEVSDTRVDNGVDKVRIADDNGAFTWCFADRFKKKSPSMTFEFVVEINEEDEVGGFFAYEQFDYDMVFPPRRNELTRGFGETSYEAIACLCALLDEQNGNYWGRETKFC